MKTGGMFDAVNVQCRHFFLFKTISRETLEMGEMVEDRGVMVVVLQC